TRDGIGRTTSRQPMTADGCSFSQGEKVRMRASHEEFCLTPLPLAPLRLTSPPKTVLLWVDMV
ncbi:MAG: hypothetical protein ABSG04_06230, partial [Verrucomicrobiota bacterium]